MEIHRPAEQISLPLSTLSLRCRVAPSQRLVRSPAPPPRPSPPLFAGELFFRVMQFSCNFMRRFYQASSNKSSNDLTGKLVAGLAVRRGVHKRALFSACQKTNGRERERERDHCRWQIKFPIRRVYYILLLSLLSTCYYRTWLYNILSCFVRDMVLINGKKCACTTRCCN